MTTLTVIGYEGALETGMNQVIVVGKAVILGKPTRKASCHIPSFEVEVTDKDVPWLVILVDNKLPCPLMFNYGYRFDVGTIKTLVGSHNRCYAFRNKTEAKKYVKSLMRWLTGATQGVANN